jgi:steroid 5-alpha reductase family enzyme
VKLYWLLFFLIGFLGATLLYGLAVKMRIMAWVDLIWSLGVGLGALAHYNFATAQDTTATCGLAIALLWSLRLSLFLLRDRVLSGREDARYAHLKAYWGATASRNFYGLFLLQVPLAALFLLPIQTALSNQATPTWLSVGLLLALLGIGGEYVSDQQLKAFKRQATHPRSVCNTGFWRYSRHPNYFFEWLHWWGYVCLAAGSSNWALSLIGPTFMYVFLRYLTGIPHTERASLAHRGEAYRQYQSSTNLFFPWKPHSRHS